MLTPRNSALLSETPNLSWFSLPDIENYTISILSDDQQDRPPVDVQGTTSDWPSSWAPLEEMATYVLIVEGNSISSDANNLEHTRLGFWLLPKEEAQEVQALAGRLREQPVSEKAANILIAELYIQHGLLAEAIKLLNSIPPTERSASLWSNIGMVYLDLGLPLEAKDAFSQSLNQAQLNGELETEANSLYGLALAHRMLNEDNTANEQLQLALDIYKEIGSTEDQERVNQLLSE